MRDRFIAVCLDPLDGSEDGVPPHIEYWSVAEAEVTQRGTVIGCLHCTSVLPSCSIMICVWSVLTFLFLLFLTLLFEAI